MQRPQTRYARSGDLSIAYQVLGEGDRDLVVVSGWVSHLDDVWEDPFQSKFFGRFATFARLVMFDKRGTGMSDPVESPPALEERIDDMRAVMDAVGSERAALFGISEGGPMSILFAATYPERVSHLVLSGTSPRWLHAPDYPHGIRPHQITAMHERIDHWGEGRTAELFVPDIADDPDTLATVGRWEARGATPTMARRLYDAALEIDVRDILPAIQAPTLVHHRRGDRVLPLAGAELIAERVPGAVLFVQEGTFHPPWLDGGRELADRIESFLTGTAPRQEMNRSLATVLFTDIVGSTALAAEIGDARWSALLDTHDDVSTRTVEEHGGRLIRHTGDGIQATFARPAAGIRCGLALCHRLAAAGIEIRAGMHPGEVELRGDELGGIAVHIGARVVELADAGEVVVSRTVKDLVAGSGLEFDDHGTHDLRGLPEPWQVHLVTGEQGADS